MPKEDIIILIAAYNEEKNIVEVVTGAKKYATRILMVDDGSKDETAKRAKAAGAMVIGHQQKMGKGEALKTGLRYAVENFKDFKALITLDGDNQHHPDDIDKISKAWQLDGAELILGARSFEGMPLDRKFWNWLCSFLISLIIKNKIKDSQSGLRLLSKKLAEKLADVLKADDYRVESEIIFIAAEEKVKISEVSARTIYNKKFSLKSLGGCFLRAGKIFYFIIGWPIKRWFRAGAF